MEIKATNPRLGYDQKATELGFSSNTLKRCSQDINMHSPYRILPNSNKRKKILTRGHDLERRQMTSNDLKIPRLTSKMVTNENIKSL